MSIFDPKPSYRVAQPYETARLALDMPLTPLNNLWQQAQQGAIDSFGLGTVIKDFSTPRGVPQPTSAGDVALRSNPITGPLMQGYDAARSLFGAPTTGKPLTAEEYKKSQYFREGVTWDAGMTEDRAAAIATQFDIRQARQFFGQKDMVTTLAGGFLGSALDPINYVPVFGPASRAAAVTKFGYVMGHGLLGASEAAINTAAFGALTTPFRGRLGEDVSWEAAINNIAFSAVAGAAFGAVGGLVSRAQSMRAAVAERDARIATETVQNLKDSRDVLNDAIASIVETGDVRLSPKSASVLERMAIDATDRRLAGRALDLETQDVKLTKPGEVVISPSGARVAVRPEVVELSSLQRASGALQVRDRSGTNAASNTQIQDIAINLDPARLMPNTDGSQGAPLVGGDNIIDSGNGRAQAIGLAYDAYPERSAAYRAALVEQGFPEAAGMEKPVLIQRRLTDLSPQARAQFNADLNGPTTARMSAVELAAMDRNAITDPVLRLYNAGTPIAAKGNREFVAEFLAGLPLNERTGLVDPAGNLNADGVRRIENAMMAAAYGDVDAVAVRKFAEATDDNTRSIVGALADVAGKWLTLRRAVSRGDISPDFDMTPELTEALRRLSGWREQAAREKRPVGVVIKEGLGQGDMLSGSISAPTKLFVRSFYADGNYTSAAGRDTIAARINDLADAALDLGQPDMLGEAYAATKLGVLNRAYGDLETDFLEAASLRTGTDEIGGTGRRSRPGAGGEGNRLGTSEDGSRRLAAATPDEIAASTRALKDAQPRRSFDELYAVADTHQAALDAAGKELGKLDGVEWKNPGVKKRADAEAKLGRKGYESTSELTDVVRGGFKVKTPGDAEAIVSALAAKFRVLDEGWNITAAGYFDRKVLVQFDDGTIGEVQIWHPDMLDAKEGKGGGHKLYEQMRGLKPDDPKFVELIQAQKALYLDAVSKASDDWLPVISRLQSALDEGGMPASGKASSNAAAVSGLPESMISAASASRQSPPDSGMNQAELPLITAGRPSQSKNFGSMREGVALPRQEGNGFEAKPGDTILVYRMGSKGGELVGNGGTARGVARHWQQTEENLKAHGDTIGVFSVTLRDAFGPYENQVGTKKATGGVVGRWDKGDGVIYYSFAEGSKGFEATKVGEFPLSEVKTSKVLVEDIPVAELAASIDVRASELLRSQDTPAVSVDAARGRADVPGNSLVASTVDMQEPRPERRPDGLDAAAARVGRGEDMRALAEQFGVDAKTGEFAEQADIDMLREQGRLTPEDEAELADAERTIADADAYAETLRVAAACVMG